MNDNNVTMRFPLYMPIMMGLFAIIFLAIFVMFLAKAPDPALLGLFGLFFVLCSYYFVYALYSAKINDQGITVWNFFRKTTLGWDEIDHVRPKMWDSLLLVDRQGARRVYLNSQVSHFPDLIVELQRRRSDLFSLSKTDTFHISWWFPLVIVAGVLGAAYFTVQLWLEEGTSAPLELGLGVLFTALFVFILTRLTFKIKLESARMIRTTLFGVQEIPFDDVANLHLGETATSGGKVLSMTVVLKNGKRFGLSNIREGMPLLIATLKEWVAANKGR